MKTHCLICSNELEDIIDFGNMPISNDFKEKLKDEYKFHMVLSFCKSCKMVQLKETPSKEKMFHDNYSFLSKTSNNMIKHFKKLSQNLFENNLLNQNSFLVEIGCNDGILLQNFKQIKHLGVEPSGNVAEIAKKDGLNVINDFFNENSSIEIYNKYGKADLICGANVFCHIPYFNDIIDGIDVLLDKNGVLVFEEPYLLDVIEKTTFDQIYDEHTFLFSITSINNAFKRIGMNIYHVEHLETHGGSMRYYLSRSNKKKTSELKFYLDKEKKLINISSFNSFKNDCMEFKKSFKELIERLKNEGKNICAYGATSKSTTLLNFCEINNSHIDCIYDNSITKIGKLTPGTNIPIVDSVNFSDCSHDYCILLAYNHQSEILSKELNFRKNGGKWILYTPVIEIL